MAMLKEQLQRVKALIDSADAIIVGAGAGLSAAGGLTYGGERFAKNFPEFIAKYHMKDMYSAGFYPFPSQEERWAYWGRHIVVNRYDAPVGEPYKNLYELLEGGAQEEVEVGGPSASSGAGDGQQPTGDPKKKMKNYFILTTNVDQQFARAGFPPERVFAMQGDYGMFQCQEACHTQLYPNEPEARAMVRETTLPQCTVPPALVPRCPRCGGHMAPNLRIDRSFVQDAHWYASSERYNQFIRKEVFGKEDDVKRNDEATANQLSPVIKKAARNVVFLELGVGMNTPGIIKFPFMQMVAAANNKEEEEEEEEEEEKGVAKARNVHLVSINLEAFDVPQRIRDKTIAVVGDINQCINALV